MRLRGFVLAWRAPLPAARFQYQRRVRLVGRAPAWAPPLPAGRAAYIESGHELELIQRIAEASLDPSVEELGKELDLLLALRSLQQEE